MKYTKSSGMSQKKRSLRGFSLVEMMVSVALGSLITIAAVQLFSTNLRTFNLQRAMTDIQEQGRFAIDFISRDMRQVGFARPNQPEPVGVVLEDFTLLGVNVEASAEGGAAANANDILRVSFYGTQDCEGDSAAAEEVVVNSYQVNADGDLVCTGSLPPAASGLAVENVNGTANGVVLLSGVDSFQVLYGVDATQNGVANVQQYVRADEVAGLPVLALRIGILLRSEEPNVGVAGAAPRDYTVLDKQLTGGTAPLAEDGVRRLFVTTVRIRNFDPETI